MTRPKGPRVYLVENYPAPVKTVPVQAMLPWTINQDSDADGRLIGIEVLDARRLLPAEFPDRFADLS